MRERCDFLRKFCFVWFLFFCVNLGYAKLEIIVKSSPDWGPISDADVEYLCQEIVDRFEEHLRPENEINQSVNVFRTTIGHSFLNLDIDDPKVKYKMGVQMKKEDIHLRDMKFLWKFIVRFGHEFTHILQVEQKGLSYRAIHNENLWFQEAIAQMGCVWVMKSMADTWKHGSRFGKGLSTPNGFAEFSENFDFYADWYMSLSPYHNTVKEWLERYEDQMRDDYRQEVAEQLGYKLLPIFEDNPEAWNAVKKMPLANAEKMDRYMQVWYEAVDVQDRQYIEAIAEVMGIRVRASTTPVILASAEIDADVNNDGYIDIRDVLLVRRAMQSFILYDTDINNDGVTDELDILIVKAKATEAIAAAAPRKRKVNIMTWGAMKKP